MYKDKKRPSPSLSTLSGSEDSPSTMAFLPLSNSGGVLAANLRRPCIRFSKYIAIAAVSLVFACCWRTFIHSHPSCNLRPTDHYQLSAEHAEGLKDTFAGYKHRGPGCNISSLDLHRPSGIPCPDRSSMLTAMSSGGRIGKDAPYVPRDCNMRWFTTHEACEILGRFSQVILVGDSMLRHVIGAMNILVREDLGYGGVTDWNFSDEERRDCFCNNQFDVRDCSVQGIFSTADVRNHDPVSLICPKVVPEWSTDLRIELIVRHPIPDVERKRLEKAIDPNPTQRKAFILGHGLWNDLETDQSAAWLDSVLGSIDSKLRASIPLRSRSTRKNSPILLVTPNAAGEKKPDEWIVSQGNKALVRFEHSMAAEAAKRRIDHLGTWNMSIQATSYDGVHMDMRGNLLKAMMVLNWLDLLDD